MRGEEEGGKGWACRARARKKGTPAQEVGEPLKERPAPRPSEDRAAAKVSEDGSQSKRKVRIQR